jgi:hypothetical protein
MDAITNSAAQCWRACRRKYLYRYERRIAPVSMPKSHALRFGALFHQGLEEMFLGHGLEGVAKRIDALCITGTPEAHEAHGVAWAMLRGYVARWMDEDRDLVRCQPELQFSLPVRNPAPRGRTSQRFVFEGKIDLVAERDGEPMIMEHKTAARLDGAYLAQLWTDAQITGYAHAAGVSQVIYDVTVKPSIRRGADEELAHYLARIEELYVGGYSAGRAKRRKGESDESWWERRRLEGEPVDMYHREHLYIGPRQIQEWAADLWDVTQEILWARRVGRWPRSTARCYDWNRPCDYAPICQSLGNEEAIIASEYEAIEAHPELSDKPEETPF